MLALREMLDRLATPSYPSYSTSLFTDVWNPKRSPVRHRSWAPSFFGLGYSTGTGYSANLGHSSVTPKLCIAGQTLTFDGGQWVDEPAIPQTSSTATSRRSSMESMGRFYANSRVRKLKRKVLNLEEENNALKVHVEMLLDMLADTMAELCAFKYTLQDTEQALAKCLKKKQAISQ